MKVGLGSDIAGGAEPGLLRQAAHAVTVSRMLEDGVDASLAADVRGVPNSRLSIIEAFYLATVGGADLLDIPVGLIEVGRKFDAVVVTTSLAGSALQIWDDTDNDHRTFEKVVRLTNPSDISDVYVNGRRVSGSRAI